MADSRLLYVTYCQCGEVLQKTNYPCCMSETRIQFAAGQYPLRPQQLSHHLPLMHTEAPSQPEPKRIEHLRELACE